jgi:hypothetical protein
MIGAIVTNQCRTRERSNGPSGATVRPSGETASRDAVAAVGSPSAARRAVCCQGLPAPPGCPPAVAAQPPRLSLRCVPRADQPDKTQLRSRGGSRPDGRPAQSAVLGCLQNLSALGHLRRDPEAAEIRQRLVTLEPLFTIERFLANNPIERECDRMHYAEGLRLTGVPTCQAVSYPSVSPSTAREPQDAGERSLNRSGAASGHRMAAPALVPLVSPLHRGGGLPARA